MSIFKTLPNSSGLFNVPDNRTEKGSRINGDWSAIMGDPEMAL